MSIPGGTTRARRSGTVIIAAGQAVSDPIALEGYTSGVLILPSAWTTADIGAQVAEDENEDYALLADTGNDFGETVSIDGPEAGRAYPLPSDWAGARYLCLFSHDGSGTAVTQEAEREIRYMLKS